MNELTVNFSLESPQEKGQKIIISIENAIEEGFVYKFMMGFNSAWTMLRDFEEGTSIEWVPTDEGKYIIMVQVKKKESRKAFDYVSKVEYSIGKVEEKLIEEIYLDKETLSVGEKLAITVETNKIPVMYRYWIGENEGWQMVKDYSSDNTLLWSAKYPGKQELLVECKNLDSHRNFDDFKKVQFEVLSMNSVEIKDFKCLNDEMLADTELMFQVEATHEDNRMVLYKFIKISESGASFCLQDYCSKRIVSFVEKQSGKYKILCMAKDMYSQKDFDDRAMIHYEVKPYKEISIRNFTTDLSTPQVCGTPVTLRANCRGGKALQYRFIIDGNHGEDSGYIKESSYVWKPKMQGSYKIDLWVKDSSFHGNFQSIATLEFVVDEDSKETVKIQDVLLDKGKKIIKNEIIHIKAIATGGIELRYSFIVRKNGTEEERVEYGTCNWVNFTPEQEGIYELEVQAKDKYSKREYDCHTVVQLEALEYLPAEIDYILLPIKDYYVVGDILSFEIITQNTKNTLLKYALKINGHKVEETEFVDTKKYEFIPKCSGLYAIDVFARNKESTKEFDVKKEIKIKVKEALPISNTKIQCDKVKISLNDSVTFTVNYNGGKAVLSEFYLMENGEFTIVQKYSRKNFYTFMSFAKGHYKVLALCKSEYKVCAYEDYDLFEFTV